MTSRCHAATRLLVPAAIAVLAMIGAASARAADQRSPGPLGRTAPTGQGGPAASGSPAQPLSPSGPDATGLPDATAPTNILSAATEIASFNPGQSGQPTGVTITSGLGGPLASASYRPAGIAITSVPPAAPVIASHRVYWVDDTGTISSLAAHTAAAVRVATVPGVLPNTRVTIAVAPNAAVIMVRAVTIPQNPLAAADERLFSIATGSDAVLLNQRADQNWADSGVPEMIGWDHVGPVEVTDANLLSLRPEHGHAVHLDAVTGNVVAAIGGDACILVSQTKGGSSLCGGASSLVFNVVNGQGRSFWKLPAPDQWIDQVAQLSPDGGRVATTDHVYDYLGGSRALPVGFTGGGWVGSTHVLGTMTATNVLAIVDIASIERVNPIAVQGRPLGVVIPDDIVTSDPPVKPTPAPAPVVSLPPPAVPPRDRTAIYVLGVLLLGGAGGYFYYSKHREQVDALVATGRGRYKQHEEGAKRKRAEALTVAPKPVAPKPQPRPTYHVVVRGPDFSAGLDERARALVMHDPQSFCNFVIRWLAQDEKGQKLVQDATPDLPEGTSREERLERGAQRLARSETFTDISRTLIVPWLSSSSR